MIAVCSKQPYLPHHPNIKITPDLEWWSDLLQAGKVSCPIYPPREFSNPLMFSDASSGIGIGIVIGDRWRAWRLVPGWQTTHNGKRDIGWAKAIGFKLLVRTLTSLPDSSDSIIVHGDNTGVVEGWWRGRHRNKAINGVFCCIHEFIQSIPRCFEVHTKYVASKVNPADGPSRGQYGPEHLLLPPVLVPDDARDSIIDATAPLTPTELRLLHDRNYPPAAAKLID
jgi:hypothetical protein